MGQLINANNHSAFKPLLHILEAILIIAAKYDNYFFNDMSSLEKICKLLNGDLGSALYYCCVCEVGAVG